MRHAGSPVCGASSLEAWVLREEWPASVRRRSGALRCDAARAGASESPEGSVETDGPAAALRRCRRTGTEPPRSKDWRVSAGWAARHFGAASPVGDASPWPEGPSAKLIFSDIARWRERWVRGRRVQPDRPANGRGAGSSSASARERQVPDSPKRRPRIRRHGRAASAHFGVRGRRGPCRRGREAGRRGRLVPTRCSGTRREWTALSRHRGSGSHSGRSESDLGLGRSGRGDCRGPRTGE
jgi:hypothetical protein